MVPENAQTHPKEDYGKLFKGVRVSKVNFFEEKCEPRKFRGMGRGG